MNLTGKRRGFGSSYSVGYKRLLLLMELGAEAPSIEFFTVSEVESLDFIEFARQGQPELTRA